MAARLDWPDATLAAVLAALTLASACSGAEAEEAAPATTEASATTTQATTTVPSTTTVPPTTTTTMSPEERAANFYETDVPLIKALMARVLRLLVWWSRGRASVHRRTHLPAPRLHRRLLRGTGRL